MLAVGLNNYGDILGREKMKNVALNVSGIIFLLVAIGHGVRYYKHWHVVMDETTVPLDASLYGGVIALILALWMFIAAASKK